MNRSQEEIEEILASFSWPDCANYPKLDGYTDDQCYTPLGHKLRLFILYRKRNL